MFYVNPNPHILCPLLWFMHVSYLPSNIQYGLREFSSRYREIIHVGFFKYNTRITLTLSHRHDKEISTSWSNRPDLTGHCKSVGSVAPRLLCLFGPRASTSTKGYHMEIPRHFIRKRGLKSLSCFNLPAFENSAVLAWIATIGLEPFHWPREVIFRNLPTAEVLKHRNPTRPPYPSIISHQTNRGMASLITGLALTARRNPVSVLALTSSSIDLCLEDEHGHVCNGERAKQKSSHLS